MSTNYVDFLELIYEKLEYELKVDRNKETCIHVHSK